MDRLKEVFVCFALIYSYFLQDVFHLIFFINEVQKQQLVVVLQQGCF